MVLGINNELANAQIFGPHVRVLGELFAVSVGVVIADFLKRF